MASSAIGHAAWHKASSKHFVIYSDDKPDKLRAYAERLERFDKAVRMIHGWDDPPIGDGNRITIYLLPSVSEIQSIYGKGDRGSVFGFYVNRYAGPVAFAPRNTQRDEWGLQADSVFFHEYGHHLMFQHFDRPYPNWYVEGFAEFIGTPSFGKDGSVSIGIAPKHRAWGLYSNEGMTTTQMLTSQPKRMSGAQQESLYSRGWLLTHFFNLEPGRRPQLVKYFDQLAVGKPMAAAATESFGDLKLLDKQLGEYLGRRMLTSINIAGRALTIGPIDVRPLSPGAAEAIRWQMRSQRGVNAQTAPPVAARLRAIGARFPADPFVQSALAEAEFDVGRHDAALAAAEAALKANPDSNHALIYKGRALMEQAAAGKPALFGEARSTFIAANKMDPEDPEPLFLFFQSYVRAGERPTTNALAALHYASVLSPGDKGVRVASAVAYLNEQKYADARRQLLPVAYDPHGGERAALVRDAIDLIDGGKGGQALRSLAANLSRSDQNEE